ncbi:MAG: class I SAM-dependent methyltransferase [Hyphomonadaceae bacterium]
MDFSDPNQRRIFFEVHEGFPRQSAGSHASTLKALGLVVGSLPDAPLIADMACGPGSSVLPLARALPDARIIAVDLHQPFLDELEHRIGGSDVNGRVSARCSDMMVPLAEAGAVDMVWCEGGIYNVGVKAGLEGWRSALKPNGLVVFNEPIWLVSENERAAKLRAFWRGYPAMTDGEGVEQAIADAGYQLLGWFDHPEEDWWNEYYTPMEARLSELKQKYAGVSAAAGPIEHSQLEIDMRRTYAASYNYRFFAAKLI